MCAEWVREAGARCGSQLVRLGVGSTLHLSLVNVDLAYMHLTSDETLKAFAAQYLIYLEEFLSVVHSL